MSPRSILLALTAALLAACGGDDGAPPPPSDGPGGAADAPSGTHDAPPPADAAACANLSGTWHITGQVGDTTCLIAQSGCALTAFPCWAGLSAASGTVTGNSFSITGTYGGLPASCAGTASASDADVIDGTCQVSAAPAQTFHGVRD